MRLLNERRIGPIRLSIPGENAASSDTLLPVMCQGRIQDLRKGGAYAQLL